MKQILLIICFSLMGCETENCYQTDQVDYEILREKPWGTYYETVYKMKCE